MSNRAWMPLHIADYLADTGHLTAAEHGAYLLLIMHYWQKGALPTDERLIARIARLSTDQWAESRDVIADLFSDGWTHKRIDAELTKADEIIEKRRAAADARHGKSKPDASAVHVQSKSTYTGASPSTTEPSSSLRSDEPAARKRVRPERLDEAWVLPEGWGQDAIEAGLPAHLIDLEASKMRDWSRSSKNGAKLDWRATWRNWCREAAARIPPARGSPQRPETPADVANRLLTEMRSANGQPGTSDSRHPQALVALPGGKRAGLG